MCWRSRRAGRFDVWMDNTESPGQSAKAKWPPDVTKQLGDYLRALRRTADVSQRDLSARSGVAHSTIERLELDGDRAGDPRLSTLSKLVQSAGCRLLICDDDNVPIVPMTELAGIFRDLGGRRLPAHLDPVKAIEERFRPWWEPRRGPYTFTRSRRWRDEARAADRRWAERYWEARMIQEADDEPSSEVVAVGLDGEIERLGELGQRLGAEVVDAHPADAAVRGVDPDHVADHLGGR